MNRQLGFSAYPVNTDDLRQALEPLLSRPGEGEGRRIAHLRRQRSEYSSSFALEELDVGLDDGSKLELMFKDLGWQGLLHQAPDAKPAFLYNPLREIETYRNILAAYQTGTANYIGAVVDTQLERYWLFLEKVPGLRLSLVGDFAVWEKAARFLAAIHSYFAGAAELPRQAQAAQLLTYDGAYFQQWATRAQEFVRASRSSVSKTVMNRFDLLTKRYSKVVEHLEALPRTLVHGELYASNIIVTEPGSSLCVIDWDMAGMGPGLIDLAALTAGDWTQDEKLALALAYHGALTPDQGYPMTPDSLLAALDFCRLHLAIQWLGWSSMHGSPPDRLAWLSEALSLAEKLEL